MEVSLPWASGSKVAVAAEGTLLWTKLLALGVPHSLLKAPSSMCTKHRLALISHLDFNLEWVHMCVLQQLGYFHPPVHPQALVPRCPQKWGTQWCLLMQTQP